MLIAAAWLVGCDEQVGGYRSVSSIANNGFLRDHKAVAKLVGREVKLWGFVDHGNLYGDAGARSILREWWAGDGPRADTWRFNLKSQANDAVGQSFPVHVPDDAGRDELLVRFVADARSQQPTKVFVRGRLRTFDAPTQGMTLTGLYLELASSWDIWAESATPAAISICVSSRPWSLHPPAASSAAPSCRISWIPRL
jgi:hypothetical protein